jgi:uncharacterized membrane protein
MTYESVILIFAKGIDILGVAVISLGIFISTIIIAYKFIIDNNPSFKIYRENISKVVLVGLELLIAGDIIRSVANFPSINDAIILGIIVAIRMVLSFQLQIEITGKLPWKKERRLSDNRK